MVIDCHYHLDERILKTDEVLKKMDAAGIEKAALMAPMCDPFPEPPPFTVGLHRYLVYHKKTRPIGRLFINNADRKGTIKTPSGRYRIYPDPDNEPVFRAAELHPERFCAWVFVNPGGSRNPFEVIDAWKSKPGFIGVKAHPFWHRYNAFSLLALAQTAAELGKPLLIHAGFGDRGNFEPLAKEIPGLNLILAHAGFPRYRDFWKIVKKYKNIFVDLSQTSYVSESITRDAVKQLGVDRCLYGTDGPYGITEMNGTYDHGFIKSRIERLFPDQGARKRILGANFAELAGIS